MKTLLASICSIALLAAFAIPSFANPAFGPVSGVDRAPANGVSIHTVTYNGGERADFSFSGDHDTDLNVLVKDSLGNVVVNTSGSGDVGHVYWTPNRTQTYTIYVVNHGSVYNQYSYRAY